MADKSCENCKFGNCTSMPPVCMQCKYNDRDADNFQPIKPDEVVKGYAKCVHYLPGLCEDKCFPVNRDRCKDGFVETELNPNTSPELIAWADKRAAEDEIKLLNSLLLNTPRTTNNVDLLVLLNTAIAVRTRKLKPLK
ncbi:MAG: hypothetical protein V1701_02805 [Planctomycetota bacterium]